MPQHLDQARQHLLAWLRSLPRDPTFLAGTSDAELALLHRRIAGEFLKWAKDAQFDYEIIRSNTDGKPAFTLHWTHRGATFVGFKQPPEEANEDDAILASCAALLANDWCRSRLPPVILHLLASHSRGTSCLSDATGLPNKPSCEG